jgi:hypothetical protein
MYIRHIQQSAEIICTETYIMGLCGHGRVCEYSNGFLLNSSSVDRIDERQLTIIGQ